MKKIKQLKFAVLLLLTVFMAFISCDEDGDGFDNDLSGTTWAVKFVPECLDCGTGTISFNNDGRTMDISSLITPNIILNENYYTFTGKSLRTNLDYIWRAPCVGFGDPFSVFHTEELDLIYDTSSKTFSGTYDVQRIGGNNGKNCFVEGYTEFTEVILTQMR